MVPKKGRCMDQAVDQHLLTLQSSFQKVITLGYARLSLMGLSTPLGRRPTRPSDCGRAGLSGVSRRPGGSGSSCSSAWRAERATTHLGRTSRRRKACSRRRRTRTPARRRGLARGASLSLALPACSAARCAARKRRAVSLCPAR